MNLKKIAQRTFKRLTRTPTDWQTIVERLPDESADAYYARLETIASESNGMISLITINRVAQRESPPADDAPPAPPDLTPLSRVVIPIVNRSSAKR